MMFWYGYDMHWWGYVGMVTITALFVILAVVGVTAMVRYVLTDRSDRRHRGPENPSPTEVLAARYARGEITETEYRDRLGVLHDHGLR